MHPHANLQRVRSSVGTDCLTENDVLALLGGGLGDAMRAKAHAHLDACTHCQELLAWVTPSMSPSGEAAEPGSASRDLPPGAMVGRYRIVDRIGAGAMGIVYVAADPDLDRRVALKMLRRQDPQASERLLREAQALARLAHPNVIVVHDVGTFEGQVYMAMEFVDGVSLAVWMRTPRPLDAILTTFEQAGRGLAAAHGAGLVHRDFKPDNVLVGRDGRVRVVDFGLVRSDVLPSTRAGGRGAADTVRRDAFVTLTRTGSFMGTPAYMAPEQYQGHPGDARTDQFGFCVSLYEAVYGRRPFEAATLVDLAIAVTTRPAVAPRRTRTPKPIERAILRGLATRADARFTSMEDLLAALRVPVAARIGAPLVVLAIVAAIAGIAVVRATRPMRPTREATPSLPAVATAGATAEPAAVSASGTASVAVAVTASASGAPSSRPRTRPHPTARPKPSDAPSASGPLMPTTP